MDFSILSWKVVKNISTTALFFATKSWFNNITENSAHFQKSSVGPRYPDGSVLFKTRRSRLWPALAVTSPPSRYLRQTSHFASALTRRFRFEASAVSENGLLSDSCVSGHRTQANYSGREHHTREAEYSPLRPHGKHVGWFPSGDTACACLRTEEFARASFPLWQVACGGETVRQNFLSPNVHLPSDLTAALWSLLESISH